MISKILVAVDGSKVAQKALKYATGLAKQTKASITLVTVIDDSALVAQYVPAEMSPTQIMEPIGQYLTKAAEKFMEKAKKLCVKNRISCHDVIRNGRPVEEILKEAKKSKVDMIVLGSHGKGTIESAIVGSVTYGVIHKSTKYPVLIIR